MGANEFIYCICIYFFLVKHCTILGKTCFSIYRTWDFPEKQTNLGDPICCTELNPMLQDLEGEGPKRRQCVSSALKSKISLA